MTQTTEITSPLSPQVNVGSSAWSSRYIVQHWLWGGGGGKKPIETYNLSLSQYILAMIVWVREFSYLFYMKNDLDIF